MNNIYYVYLHRRASDNQVFYVGKGKGKRSHDLANRNRHWHNIVNKHGFKVDIVATELTDAEAIQFEIDTILEMKYFGFTLANKTNGGEGKSGYVTSEETKRKISIGNSGKKLTEEHKLKVGKAMKGRFVSEETRKKQSINNVFRRPDVIKRISEANKKPIMCSNGVRFDSASDAGRWAKQIGKSKTCDGSSITAACTGRQKTAFGFTWSYV